MRLRRLVLARYGKFTGRTIDFGEAIAGAPDLHIVHGPNEAGKSTAFSGFLDLLFGIELQSRYGFLHSYDAMQVGACLELSGGPRDLVRIKKRQLSLLDAANQPVPETLIAGELGGLDRAAYRTMFSLDDDTLEQGGDSILASKGDLGELLFAASAGLSELSGTLAGIRLAADGFAKPHARTGELPQLKAKLTDLKQRREAIDTLASVYNRLAATRDDAARRYQEALVQRVTTKTELARVQRLLAALPQMAALRTLHDRLARFGPLPAVPASWQAELPALEQAETRHRSATEQAEAEVERLAALIAATVVDPAALRLHGTLDTLTTLEKRNATAALDLPVRRVELARADEAVRGVLARMDQADAPDPARLRIGKPQIDALNALLQARSGIEATLAAATEEHLRAVHDLSEARRGLGPDTTAAEAGVLAAVDGALRAWTGSDHALRHRTHTKDRGRHAAALVAALAALAPWAGDAPALLALTLPDKETIEAWRATAEKQDKLVDRREEERASQEQDAADQSARHEAAKAAAPADDAAALAVRTAREAAWAAHRRTLDQPTADAFEAALRRDDQVAAAQVAQARDRATLHEITQALHVATTKLDQARAREAEARDAAARHAASVTAALARVSPALATLSPAQLPGWADRHQVACAAYRDLAEAEREVEAADSDGDALQARLHQALAAAGVPVHPAAAPDIVVSAAQGFAQRETRVQAALDDIAACTKAAGQRELAFNRAVSADAAWWQSWRDACRGCLLGEAGADRAVGAMRTIVGAAPDLTPALDTQAGLAARIQAMEADQAAFGHEARRVAAALGLAMEGRSAPDLAQAVNDQVQAASRADETRRTHAADHAAAEDRNRTARDDAHTHASRRDEILATLQAGSLLEAAGKLRDITERADLDAQAGAAEQAILHPLGAATLAEATALLDGVTGPALEGEEAALSAALDDLLTRTEQLYAAQQNAIDAIDSIGGDNAAALIEEQRKTHLLDIQDKAQRYLRLRLGIAAADRALRTYRDQHRSSMLQQASDAFSTISRGAYRGLGTQPGKDGDILVALSADGSSKLAPQLSKGTRFQLYLALRAAGYREFARHRPPVPFIADDIMETFDDLRAEETLKILGDMSRLGQVIYLTHHGHLRAIAERTVPGVRIHELAP